MNMRAGRLNRFFFNLIDCLLVATSHASRTICNINKRFAIPIVVPTVATIAVLLPDLNAFAVTITSSNGVVRITTPCGVFKSRSEIGMAAFW
jgi:hypothetical protein